MKKYTLICAVLFVLLNACEQSNDTPLPVIDDEEYTIRFNLGGEISFNDSPIGGRVASTGEQTYYAVQITDLSGGVHASGLFDHIPADLSVTLFKDRTYRAEVQAMRKGESYGLRKLTDSTLQIDGASRVITNQLTYNVSLGFFPVQNEYIYYYTSADSSSVAHTGPAYSSAPPNILDFYYGLIDIDSTALASDSTVSLRLIRNVFGYETVVSGLQSGVLDVTVASQFLRYSTDGDSTESRVLSYPTNSADSSFYSRNYTVRVIHHDTIDNIAVSTTLFNSSVPFMRLHKKNIHITAPADTSSTGSADNNYGFTLSLEDTPLLDGDTLNIQ